MTSRCLPIIGNVQKSKAGWSATEPITTAQLKTVIRSPWCRGVRTIDGPSSGPESVTYFLLAEIDGDVLNITGTAVGGR